MRTRWEGTLSYFLILATPPTNTLEVHTTAVTVKLT